MQMRKILLPLLFLLSGALVAQPDTVRVGAYMMSVHDINFHDKEYTARFWLWFIYSNPAFDFVKQLDITNAKSIDSPQLLEDSLNGKKWSMLKMKSVMKENWNVQDFPFDKQHLQIQIENSLFDKKSLVFKPDLKGSKFDPDETLVGWSIKNFNVKTADNLYETGFGDNRPEKDHQTFSAFIIEMDIERNALGLFMKIFIGMYISFFIAMLSFTIKPWELEPRFGLPVGGLFAAVGNKYIIDSILPESSTFTLVDTLHSLTFFSIFIVLVISVVSLKIHERDQVERSLRINKIGGWLLVSTYVLINIIFVTLAVRG
jgi:hypothetical protein